MDNIGTVDLVNRNEYSKTAIFMRMPDDVMNLLEKYALNQKSSSSKLTIKFDDKSGVIKIPNDGHEEAFNFNISGSTRGRDSTYCVQETDEGSLEAVAVVQRQKINIIPSVNSFEKTRSKITNQRKTNLCREVEMPNLLTRPKKVAVKRSSTLAEAPKSVTVNAKKKYIPYKGFDIVSQPLRKRIVHMLALKPSKKSEILDRLMKEGISEFEKSKMVVILYQVGCPKNNLSDIFHLDSKSWKEVEDEWKFYSPEEAAIVQRKKREAFQNDIKLKPKSPPNNLAPKKRSLVDEIIASSMPFEKKQKSITVKENSGLPTQCVKKNCAIPTFESKESNIQAPTPPSKKKRKRNRKRKRKKNKNLSLSNSEVGSYLPSTVMKKTNPVLPKDSCPVEKITSPPVAPSSTVDDTTLDANRVDLQNSNSFLSFKDDSCLVQMDNVPFLEEIPNNNTPENVEKPALSVTEFPNFDSFNPKSEETHKKDISPSTIMEFSETLPKEKEFAPTDCIKNLEPHVLKTQELTLPAASHSTSVSSHSGALHSHSTSISSHPASCSHPASPSRAILYNMYKILALEARKAPVLEAGDLKRSFCKITSLEQRDNYKNIFDFEYPTYKVLWNSVSEAFEKMNHLEDILKTLKEGTQEYDAALLKLCQVYKMYVQNSEHRICNQLLLQYHKKLSYLSSLIHEFDSEHYGKLSSKISE